MFSSISSFLPSSLGLGDKDKDKDPTPTTDPAPRGRATLDEAARVSNVDAGSSSRATSVVASLKDGIEGVRKPRKAKKEKPMSEVRIGA